MIVNKRVKHDILSLFLVILAFPGYRAKDSSRTEDISVVVAGSNDRIFPRHCPGTEI